jgi:TPR repeat protein
MKCNRSIGVLLLVVLSSAVSLFGQPTEAERKQFEAVKARAEKGDSEAQIALAARYARGDGVAKDPAKAVKWLRKAADQGSARAQCLLGLDYASGSGIKPDKAEAARWLRRAADQGLAEAQFDLGMCYANGDGVPRNALEATAWYRKAADQGLPDAACELGNCYLEGTGVPKDIPEGVKWTRKAAEEGFGQAQNTLGLCYTKGTGVPKDYLEAYKWFNLAAAKGDERADDARVNLASAERYLTPEQVAEAQRRAMEFKPRKASATDESGSAPAKAGAQSPGSGTGSNAAWPAASLSATAARIGVVNVKAEDDSYEIFVDGAFVGNTPAKVKLGEGAHVVEVKKAGFKDYRKQISITEGSELTLRAVLEKQ